MKGKYVGFSFYLPKPIETTFFFNATSNPCFLPIPVSCTTLSITIVDINEMKKVVC